MAFLPRVLSLIDSIGISKNKLLTDLGINKSAFINWENRGTVPSGDVVAKIADYFHVSTDYLLGRTNDPRPADEEADRTAEAPAGPQYPPEYDLLSPEDQELIDNMIRRLIIEKNQEAGSSPSNGVGKKMA